MKDIYCHPHGSVYRLMILLLYSSLVDECNVAIMLPDLIYSAVKYLVIESFQSKMCIYIDEINFGGAKRSAKESFYVFFLIV